MVVLACIESTIMASTKSNNPSRINCEYFNSINSDLVSMQLYHLAITLKRTLMEQEICSPTHKRTCGYQTAQL